jgi:3-methyladenine DNA glycosylase/8-oxoguanine DNA glycosylase
MLFMETPETPAAPTLSIPTPPDFDLAGVATAHGWHQLAPYSWSPEAAELGYTDALPSGAVFHLRLAQAPGAIEARVEPRPQAERLPELVRRLRWQLRLDEDLSEFAALCRADPALCEATRRSGGRLLRCPTLWEDVVKTILTTNTTWRQTRAMASRLVAELGAPLPTDPSLRAFPSPSAVAGAGEGHLQERTRLGYRAAFVARLARDLRAGELDLEGLKRADLPTAELRRRLLALPGVGPYAAATLCMLLGRYDELAVDTELRAHVRRKYFGGAAATEAEMREVYARWGRWRYLAYWFDPRAE